MALILDACSLIAYLRGEAGGERLAKILADGTESVSMHAVNAGEVYYDGLKRREPAMGEFWQDISKVGIVVRRDMDDEFVTIAAHWKAKYRIAYADAFALALAQRESARLVTTDHHELDPIEAVSGISFLWLR